ncbi:DNA mismatch repair protein Msh6-like isoform X2 [Stegodyphus dumicola]|nr:DNA mismatch repair protein Msh6-like isoform X2 [Stegodyphus dumicola]
MSKPKTLLDFFSKSPASKPIPKTPKSQTPVSKNSASENILSSKKSLNGICNSDSQTPSRKSEINRKSEKTTNKRHAPLGSDVDSEREAETDEEEKVTTSKTKRRRIIIASGSEDSEDEYKPGKESSDSEGSASAVSENSDESPVKKKRKTMKKTTLLSPSLASVKSPKASPNSSSPKTLSLNSPRSTLPVTPASGSSRKLSTNVSKQKSCEATNDDESSKSEDNLKEYLHETLDWLNDDKIRDKSGKPKSHPDYNPRTLFVPDSFKKNLTPAMKQWWDMKSDHFDTVLFFKVGKFYELYHMDAVVGVKELGLVFMKGDFAHSGFPEIAFGRYSECLIEKGYKVARVEQTETPQMMEERCKSLHRPTKFDKVVAREICQITTKGTRTLTYQSEPMAANNNYLLAICEKYDEGEGGASEYGVCFIDVTIGKFSLGQFMDDRHGSRLMTLIALYPPSEILYERSSVSKKTLQLLDNNLNRVSKEALSSGSQFWDSTKVLKFLSASGYFKGENDVLECPETILKMLDEDDRLLQTPLKNYELAFKSLGACIWYLKESCIEDAVLTMKLFEEFKPLDGIAVATKESNEFIKQHMVLDGVTLQNLDIVPVHPLDTTDESLLGVMDFCSTSFGKRLFRHWLCSPLCNPRSITDRLDAIDDLMEICDTVEVVVELLKKIPDLERFLSKIHTQGLNRSKSHPEMRAIFYESDIYNKKKLLDFLSTLDGFKESIKVISHFEDHLENFKSSILKECTSTTKVGGRFPDLSEKLVYFDHAFDHEVAKKEGNFIPRPGVDEEYDSACAEIEETEKDLESYLQEQKQLLNCKVTYVGSAKTRFQLEVPDNKKVPSNFEFQGARKGFKRYYTQECKDFVTRISKAEENRKVALRDVARRIFAQFDKDYNMWKAAVHCLSVLDVLISLLTYYKTSAVTMCRPKFSLPSEDTKPFLEIIEGRHPTLLKYFTNDAYIPNSVYIGPKREPEKENINSGGQLVLVTGSNMGGKSTLMRQAGTLVIMAQM